MNYYRHLSVKVLIFLYIRRYVYESLRLYVPIIHGCVLYSGFALIAFGIYILVIDWSVPTDFFRAAGIMIVLFGIILLLMAHMGLQGIIQQNARYGKR